MGYMLYNVFANLECVKGTKFNVYMHYASYSVDCVHAQSSRLYMWSNRTSVIDNTFFSKVGTKSIT